MYVPGIEARGFWIWLIALAGVCCLALFPARAVGAPRQADLTVTVSGPAAAAFGTAVAYDITLVNHGNVTASGTLLRVTYSSQLHLQSAGGLRCANVPTPRFSAPQLACSGTMPAGSARLLTLTGTTPNYATSLSVTAVAGANTAAVRTDVATLLPALTVDATAIPDTIQAGGIFTSTIGVTNTGTASADNITLVDSLPAGSTFVSATATNGFTCVGPGDTVTCNGGSLAPGARAQVQIDARAPLTTGPATTTIVVDLANSNNNNNNNNNNGNNNNSNNGSSTTRSLSIVAGLADLTITFAATPSVVSVGTPFEVVLSVSNIGTAVAAPVSVKDSFTRVSLASFSASNGFTCKSSHFKVRGGAVGAVSGVECDGGSVAPGETATIALQLIADTMPQVWTQQATVNPTGAVKESNYTNNSASSTVTFQ